MRQLVQWFSPLANGLSMVMLNSQRALSAITYLEFRWKIKNPLVEQGNHSRLQLEYWWITTWPTSRNLPFIARDHRHRSDEMGDLAIVGNGNHLGEPVHNWLCQIHQCGFEGIPKYCQMPFSHAPSLAATIASPHGTPSAQNQKLAICNPQILLQRGSSCFPSIDVGYVLSTVEAKTPGSSWVHVQFSTAMASPYLRGCGRCGSAVPGAAGTVPRGPRIARAVEYRPGDVSNSFPSLYTTRWHLAMSQNPGTRMV